MVIHRMTIDVHNIRTIHLRRKSSPETTTRWISIEIVDKDDNEYGIGCFDCDVEAEVINEVPPRIEMPAQEVLAGAEKRESL